MTDEKNQKYILMKLDTLEKRVNRLQKQVAGIISGRKKRLKRFKAML